MLNQHCLNFLRTVLGDLQNASGHARWLDVDEVRLKIKEQIEILASLLLAH